MSGRSPSVFESHSFPFVCQIALYRKLPGTSLFTEILGDQSSLSLGEEIQLRSKVRSYDGWRFSKLGEVVIQRLTKRAEQRQRTVDTTAVLVYSNGCRNPLYKVLAPDHPRRTPTDPLENRFMFRAFMFQDMDAGEPIMISAKVVGCLEESDCTITCDDNAVRRKRGKREIKEYSFTTVVPGLDGILLPSSNREPKSEGYSFTKGNVTNWSRNMAIRVKLPDASVASSVSTQECQLYLFITLGVSLVFCAASVVFVVVTFFRSQRNIKKEPQPFPVQMVQGAPHIPRIHKTNQKALQSPPNNLPNGSMSQNLVANYQSGIENELLQNVPATVRLRKRNVNAEIIGMFNNPYTDYFHPSDFYGYKIVPNTEKRPHLYKKSLKAIKREQRDLHCKDHTVKDKCSCVKEGEWEDFKKDNRDNSNNRDRDNVSVIHIKASEPTESSSQYRENIYSELTSEPTMV